MKAKTVYLHPKDMHHILRDAHGGCVKHLVIEPSSMDKVIERAARAIARVMIKKGTLSANNAGWYARDVLTPLARAAYRAGGFIK